MILLVLVLSYLSILITASPPHLRPWPAQPAKPPYSVPETNTSCPGDSLPGTVLLPVLTVPVSKKQPQKAYGNSNNFTIYTANDVGTIINFLIPPEAANKTCSLYFATPNTNGYDVERKPISHTNPYNKNWNAPASDDASIGGGPSSGVKSPSDFQFSYFAYPATFKTTYATLPPIVFNLGSFSIPPGSGLHLISSIPCPPPGIISGVTFTNDTDVKFMQTDAQGNINRWMSKRSWGWGSGYGGGGSGYGGAGKVGSTCPVGLFTTFE